MKICAIVLLSHSVTMLCSRQWSRNWLRDICSAIAKANIWFNQQSMSAMQSNRHGPCQRCERQTSRQQNRSTSWEDQKLRGVLWRKTITHGWIILDGFFELHPENQDAVIVMLKNMHERQKDLSRKNDIVNRFAVFMDSRDIQCTQRVHEGDRLEFKLYRVDQEFGAYEITS